LGHRISLQSQNFKCQASQFRKNKEGSSINQISDSNYLHYLRLGLEEQT